MHKIALDAMGGDFAPREVIRGAFDAIKEYPIEIILVGPQDILEQEVVKYGKWPCERMLIKHAPEVVGMSESPNVSFRKKKESSIQVGLKMVKDGQANAFVSAGNTGAVMVASTLILGRIQDVERPAIASLIPTRKHPILMLDMGAAVDCKPEHLAQFATMGHCFAKNVMGIKKPRIGLLNIGEEPEKGNAQALAAYGLISKLPLNFVGNIEGKGIFKAAADVVVCDGFIGNSLLKFGEGASSMFQDFFRTESKRSLLSLFAMMLLMPSLKRFKKKFDHREVGGAPLLGVKGISIIAHGSSKNVAIKNAINRAMQAVDNDIVQKIDTEIHIES